MKKIDFYISSLSGGGAEKVLICIAKRLAELGNEVSSISLEKRKQFYNVPNYINIYRYDNTKLGKREVLNDYKCIKKHLLNSNADISISFLSRCNLLLLVAALFRKNKIIVCDRNNPLKEHSKFTFTLSNLLYRRANKIIVQTNQIKNFYWRINKSNISVIENPIDTVSLNKQIYQIPKREKVIISVGRLEKQKDFKTLIKAFALIKNKYPDWSIKIFGQGNMEEELQRLIIDKNLEEHIFLCGRTDKPYYEMRKASIFVLSSFYEGFPNVLCEAMYAGNLCIASNCISGPKELIEDGQNGKLFSIGNEKELAEVLEEFIVHEKDFEYIRENAQKTVERLYLDKNINIWLQIIEETIQGE